MFDIVDCAALLAKELHEGQTDKAGIDYFEGHLSHVASYCDETYTKVMAYLHDAAEDTQYTEEEIIAKLDQKAEEQLDRHLLSKEIERLVSGLKLLNQHNYNNREEYIEGFKKDASAMFIKITDLKHNLDISRIPNPTEKDYQRVERYLKELNTLRLWYNDPTLW